MTHIQLDFSKTLEFFGEHELKQQQEIVKSIHKTIHEGTGAGSASLGWVDLPVDYDKEEFSRIVEASKRIKESSDVLVVYRYWWFLLRCTCSNRNVNVII